MHTLANKLEFVINEILTYVSNQSEVLICDSLADNNFTNTQKHILMLLKKEDITNKELANQLKISQAAVTKAIKSLISQNMIVSEKDLNDARILHYTLSEEAMRIAEEHEEHHVQTLKSFEDIFSEYTTDERIVIDRFLDDLVKKLRD